MPRQGDINPTALPARIRLWLLDHPGSHRARDVAEGLGVPDGMARKVWSQKVANAIARETRAGKIIREEAQLPGWSVPCGVYRLPQAVPENAP